MARLSNPPILSQLLSARGFAEQTSALRALKNDVVGHAQKKEMWAGLGALDPVVEILNAARSPVKVNGKDTRPSASSRWLSEEETLRLQALQLLASFANGGTAFVEPLLVAGALPAVLHNICPISNAPLLVTAALRVVLNIIEAAALSQPTSPVDTQALADAVFASEHIESFNSILCSTPTVPEHQTQITLVASIISQLCRDERHQLAMASQGVLDSLATRLASIAVAEGHVVPYAEVLGRVDRMSDFIPEPAPSSSILAPVLEALATIISDSRFRACMLLCSPAIMAIFPAMKFTPSKEVRAPWNSLEVSGLGFARQQSLSAIDYLLPAVPIQQGRVSGSQQSHFPALGSSEARERARSAASKYSSTASVWEASRFELFGNEGETDEEQESPLIPWLIVMVRSRQNLERLMAANLLTSLFRSGFGTKCLRETSLGLLVVPVLMAMLDQLQAAPPVVKSPLIDADTALKWTILERTPAILARMITDSEPLQKAAFDCGAVKCYSKLLKDAYEPIPPSAYAKVWSPQVDANMEMGNTSPSCALGPGGQPPLLAHRVRMRESALKAIGALAAGKDEYRKAFVEQDVVAHIVQSLSPTPGKPSNPKDRSKPTEPDGPVRDGSSPDHNSGYGSNPLSVLIAGCHAVRMLSRSVSILRTSLVDYAVAVPLFRFLRHPNVDVQIAATAAICNLVTSVSSMREVLADRGVMKILCEHAHSLNPALRLNALWALKHYVHDVDPETKKHCLEELESGWLVQLICDDTEDDALFLARSKMDKHTAVDTGDDLDGDIEMDQADPLSRSWISSTMPPQDADGRSSAKLRQAEAKLAALREAEINPLRKARNDDLAIQEQGLDFIRNMIGTTSKEDDNETKTAEMIDYLFSELGQDRFFDILARKLQAKVLHPTSRRSTGPGRETRVLYPQAKIIQAVVYVLVHMAASVPRHKQLVVAQTDLLKLLANHFNSKDKEVRVALCHLITNLTCPGDGSRTSAQRVYELKKLGFLTKLEGLEDDCELDVRERAKGAVCQMKQNNSY
ncbi:armadillo repeat protein [Colletotrichum higginsianum]|uniref:Armadillo repeat protein n=1 Tax=Colletotrichum higginsianum (strain IMI 349063) TaxID=759273 RepID=H1VBY9_COLHI|nr:Armadillo repeat protein [Colletotrichum higginsianum IMI 349063]OBR03603.1 Armadillo repeat protein [Colletotrichum higginsianum IMI 349063]CCF37742.1 armadillo repeat protein [Colletotrichum higginsianum]